MNKSPLVSVIIPCYNVQEFVEKAVYSILNQTYKNLEVIIVDDASTDGTLEIIKNIHDARIKLISLQVNTKKIGAVNTALKESKGDFIAFQDADDWSDTERFKKQLEAFNSDASLGICFTNYKYAGRKATRPLTIALTDDELKDEFLNFGSKRNIELAPTMCATMMITREVLNNTNGYHLYFAGRVAEDIHWVYRILRKYKGAALKEHLYTIRVREGSLTQLQFSGVNPKAAYTWQLLSKIISKDVNENIDLLSPEYSDELKRMELLACEEALVDTILLLNKTTNAYRSSTKYRVGTWLLWPACLLRSMIIKS